jgi:hypothetical protein
MERSLEKITKNDLSQLLSIARADIDEFFQRNPHYIADYQGKEKLIALGQGAALHYVDGVNGVKDFDVWFFYPKFAQNLPYRRRGVADFGKSKLDVHPEDRGFSGRRVNILMRSDTRFNHGAPDRCLGAYLAAGRTVTAKQLAAKAFVGLYPEPFFGNVLWPL